MKRLCETADGLDTITNVNIKEKLETLGLRTGGLRTQCVQRKNAKNCNAMCLAQLCLKINAKMGKVNNIVEETDQIKRYC